MFSKQKKNLLPGKSTILIFRLFPKFIFVFSLLFYLSGYQPVFSLPPFQKAIALAAFSQSQEISLTTLGEPFTLPHPGFLTTKFSSWHPGIDLATGLGMPIHPILSGKVIEVTFGFFGLGHYVVMEHQDGFKSTYGHLGRIFVKVGDLVKQSSFLGEVGVSGHTSGPHTHLEISKNGQYIDPQTVLPKIPDEKTYSTISPSKVTTGPL